jgi:hypothetical protein
MLDLYKKYDDVSNAILFINSLVTENEMEELEKFDMLITLTLKLKNISNIIEKTKNK